MKAIILAAFLSVGCALDVNGTGLPPDPSTIVKSSPLQGDAGVCHVLTMHKLTTVPSLCTAIQVEGDPLAMGDAYFSAATTSNGFGCSLVAAPIACTGCNYTCECFEKTVSGKCSCSQDTVGGLVAMVCP